MKNLITLRQNAHLTQKALAEKMGISKANIGFYEVGKTQPSLETLIKLADYFGCSVDYLLGHETKGIIHLDSFTEPQQKLVNLITKLNYEQALFLVGYVSDMLGLAYHSVKPIKPW